MSTNKECIFCNIVQKKDNKLYEDNLVYLFKDYAPKADHHFLIIPKKHMRDSSHIRSYEDFDLVEHMINVAHNYVIENLGDQYDHMKDI